MGHRFPQDDQEQNEPAAQDMLLFFRIEAREPLHRVSCVLFHGARAASSFLMPSVRATAAIINTSIPANISGSR